MKRALMFLTPCLALLWAGPLAANADNCAVCHEDPMFRSEHRALFDYTASFQSSAHGEAGLECMDCHGGDATRGDLELVHEGVMAPVRRDCIPETCGKCHEEQRDAFVNSRHSRRLLDGNEGPNCVTCHGAMNLNRIAVADVKATCQGCHTEGKGIDAAVPAAAERILTTINNIKGYRRFVNRHGDDEAFRLRSEQAYLSLTSAWHRFDLAGVAEDSEALLAELRREKDKIIDQRRKR